MKLYMKAKANTFSAVADYENGNLIVLTGSIRIDYFSKSISGGGKTAFTLREHADFVNEEGIVLRDIKFTSPSTAAQFVSGRNTNGLIAWKIQDRNTTLKEYLEKN